MSNYDPIKLRDVQGTDIHPDHAEGVFDKLNSGLARLNAFSGEKVILLGKDGVGWAAASDKRFAALTGSGAATPLYVDLTRAAAGRSIAKVELVYSVAGTALDALTVALVKLTPAAAGTAPVEADVVAAADWTIASPDDSDTIKAIAADKRVTFVPDTHDAVPSTSIPLLKIVGDLNQAGDTLTLKMAIVTFNDAVVDVT